MADSREPTPAGGPERNPGDEATPGASQTGDQICPSCGGSGRREDRACTGCGGSGRVTVIVGDA